jgi:glycosyltransferase involved in cell wall biosynthesis
MPMAARIAFVPPRFGPQVVGGSEAASRQVALGFAARGWHVEVLTTCAVNHYTWANDLKEGMTVEDGLRVRRFENIFQSSEAGYRAQMKIQAEILPTIDEQVAWLSWRFTVPDLFEHLLRHGAEYDAIMFSPYMFWTTTVCQPAVSDRAVAMPCLHDEFYARLDVVRPVLADAARVWFLSEPEHELAHRLGPLAPDHTVTGLGVHVPSGYEPDRFRRRHGLTRPFILFAGRRAPEKGWHWLVDQFADATHEHGLDLDLVTMGAGDIDPRSDIASRVIDLGLVSAEDRDDAMAAAVAYVQPSRMESFSLSVMESWLAGTPVLAIEGSEVVGWHCRRSGGGRIFADGTELAAILHELTADPGARAEMAARGRNYVLENYAWPVVLDRMERDLETLR